MDRFDRPGVAYRAPPLPEPAAERASVRSFLVGFVAGVCLTLAILVLFGWLS